jgi:hypothetical protein
MDRHNEFVVNILEGTISFSFSSLSYERSKAFSKANFPGDLELPPSNESILSFP